MTRARSRSHWMLGAALLGMAAPVPADEAAIARCRKIAEASQRLACYDAIALPAISLAAPAASAVLAAVPATPQAIAPRSAAERDFGAPAKADEIEFIDSTLAEEIDGWRANTRFRLANGQVWQVVDDSSGVLRSGARKVRVRRGALGAFFIEFENTNRSPRVKRVQ